MVNTVGAVGPRGVASALVALLLGRGIGVLAQRGQPAVAVHPAHRLRTVITLAAVRFLVAFKQCPLRQAHQRAVPLQEGQTLDRPHDREGPAGAAFSLVFHPGHCARGHPVQALEPPSGRRARRVKRGGEGF